jgi:methylenetetrahydrofolate reductase (NADPH)
VKIIDILKQKRTLSFEVFPPRPGEDADMKGIFSTVARLASACPDFISVTYSATGKNRARALEIAGFIQRAGIAPLSHFTAVGYLKADVDAMIKDMAERGLENVLSLRGDVPEGLEYPHSPWQDFHYAADLMRYIRENSTLCQAGAAYPHGHQDDLNVDFGIEVLKQKAAAGADFFITQLFFDNAAFFSFLEKAQKAGITQPIIPGIQPILRAKQVKRLQNLSGCVIPPDLGALLERYSDDDASMEKAGIEFAAKQVEGLWAAGVAGIHLYTMNRPIASLQILDRVTLR